MDYEAVTTNLTFSISMLTNVVTIPIHDDLIVENDKSFNMTLATFDTAATLRLRTASVTITDNDSKLRCTQYTHIVLFESLVLVLSTSIFITFSGVTIGFNITEYYVSEGIGSVSAIVSVLSGTLARDVSVRVFTSDDSATSEGRCNFTTSC